MSSFITFVCSEGRKKNPKKKKTKKKRETLKPGKGKSIPVPTKKKESEDILEEKKESEGILEVKHVTYKELQQNKYKEAKEKGNVVVVGNNKNKMEEFWINYGTTFAALSFFDTALSTKYTFQTLPEYVNVEVSMLTRYLRNIFNMANNVDWEIQRKNHFEKLFSIIVNTVRDNKKQLMENQAILSISDISNQYYTNIGNLHGVFNDIWQTMSNNPEASRFNFNWNILSKDEVFNKIKNDSRFETVFVMISEAFKLSKGEKLTEEQWNILWANFWSTTLSSLVFKFESNYMNNKILYYLRDKVYKSINIYKNLIATIDVNGQIFQQIFGDGRYPKISNLREIKDNLREIYTQEKHTNIHEYFLSYKKLVGEERRYDRWFFDVKEKMSANKQNNDAKSCTVMLHNAKTINF